MLLALQTLPRQRAPYAASRAAPFGGRWLCRAAPAGSDARGVFDAFSHGSNVTIFDARCVQMRLRCKHVIADHQICVP